MRKGREEGRNKGWKEGERRKGDELEMAERKRDREREREGGRTEGE